MLSIEDFLISNIDVVYRILIFITSLTLISALN